MASSSSVLGGTRLEGGDLSLELHKSSESLLDTENLLRWTTGPSLSLSERALLLDAPQFWQWAAVSSEMDRHIVPSQR